MKSKQKSLQLLSFLSVVAVLTFCQLSSAHSNHNDVCIIGAGASGMYAALHLHDRGYNITVIEKENRVGGHSHTYRPDDVSEGYDYGVRLLPNTKEVREMYDRFGLSLKKIRLDSLKRKYVDISTGQLSEYKEPPWYSILWSLFRYWYHSGYSYPFLTYPGINLPDNIPDDLFLPFGEYLKKYNINNSFSPLIHYMQGLGEIENIPMLYVFRNMTHDVAGYVFWDNYYTPEQGTDKLYWKIYEYLSSDKVLLNMEIKDITRKENSSIIVKLENSGKSLILTCDNLLVTSPLLLSCLSFLDLDTREIKLFSEFKAHGYWTGIVNITGLPSDEGIFNVNSKTISKSAKFPAIYAILPTQFPQEYNVLYGADDLLPDEIVKDNIIKDINRLQNLTGKPVILNRFVKFLNHYPFNLYVNNDAIKSGFYRELNNIQGYRSTWYTGASFGNLSTPDTWQHAKMILDKNFPPKFQH